MSNFTFMKKYMQKSETKLIEPLITLTIELDDDKFSQINIYEDSNPDALAEKFITDNYLSQTYLEPLKQNIINQMLQYDQMKHPESKQSQQNTIKKKAPNKENQATPRKNTPNKRQTKSPSDRSLNVNNASNRRYQTETTDIYEKLYQQSKQMNQIRQAKKEQSIQNQMKDPNLTFAPKINRKSPSVQRSKSPLNKQLVNIKSPRLNELCKQKQFDFEMPKKEVKISILENEESVTQLPRNQDSPNNVSFSEEGQFKNAPYTADQVESSLSNLLRDSDDRIIYKLFNMIQFNKMVDPRNIPYEKFSYQLIVQLRTHFQKQDFKSLDQSEFYNTVRRNYVLMKCAAEFFQM